MKTPGSVRGFSSLAGLLLLVSGFASAGPIVDDLGRLVRVGTRPARIVALSPHLVEVVFALGAGDRLVGVSDHSNHPPEAARLPVVGTLAGDPERILAVRPDLVLATTEGNDRSVVSRLESIGVPVFVAVPSNLDAAVASIGRIGEAIGAGPEGRRLVATMQQRIDRVARLPRPAHPPRVAWLVWPDPPVVAGRGSFLDDLVRRAGGWNAFGETSSAWPTVGREQLVAARLDIVLCPESKDTSDAFRRSREGTLGRLLGRSVSWRSLDGDRAQRPGPRVVDLLEELARIFREPPGGVSAGARP